MYTTPMERETVLTAVMLVNITGEMSVRAFSPVDKDIDGLFSFIDEGDDTDFASNLTIPTNFIRSSSTLHLIGLDGNRHVDLGVMLLPTDQSNTHFSGTLFTQPEDAGAVVSQSSVPFKLEVCTPKPVYSAISST